ncbi:leucyl aminopeptidase [Kitasatospora viridis]|uniref:Probable cytosol aminopeptidase n=1 Tax=Kitasatospora viridis TaxID=281105 RepID=A0A561SEY4_9ACTN|nr:leucyl aminopeptidase [Kitasatospora viridis]TWF73425.1 leucyl aminopeptidase [Kitasatospora viridis]
MTVRWELRAAPHPDTEAVVRPVWAGEPLDGLPAALADGLSPAYLAAAGFAGGLGQVLHLPGAPATVLLGLGPRPPAGAGPAAAAAAVRTAAAGLARAVRPYRHLAVHPPAAVPLRPLVEGYVLGGYRFVKYRSTAEAPPHQRIDLLAPDTEPARRSVAEGCDLAGAVLLARDLVNEPGEALTPPVFAERAAAVAERSGLVCEVWDAERIAAEKLGGLLGVSRGSLLPPRLVRLGYRPAGWSRRIALVGKGVTFDAGGLSLKPNAHLAGMKADMAGAAAVLGAMSALGALGCRVAVDAWLPLTENMPNADPIRVGDVLVMRDGTTVEICHADAEGRLIMADALVLAGETAPDAIIDLATLTDAAAVALGRRIAAVMGTDRALLDALTSAAERAGEPLWPLPLPDAYRPQLRSKVADLVNYTLGTRHGTALLAGLFLREFVPAGVPWAHLDIQGTALCEADDGEWVAGGTGFGVRTLIELLTAPPTT